MTINVSRKRARFVNMITMTIASNASLSSGNLFPSWIVLAFHLNRTHAVYQLPGCYLCERRPGSFIRWTRSSLHCARFHGHVWVSVLLIRSSLDDPVIDTVYHWYEYRRIDIAITIFVAEYVAKDRWPVSLLRDISFRLRRSLSFYRYVIKLKFNFMW